MERGARAALVFRGAEVFLLQLSQPWPWRVSIPWNAGPSVGNRSSKRGSRAPRARCKPQLSRLDAGNISVTSVSTNALCLPRLWCYEYGLVCVGCSYVFPPLLSPSQYSVSLVMFELAFWARLPLFASSACAPRNICLMMTLAQFQHRASRAGHCI